ncbi:hypothetical protein, partial [Ferrovibrio sp.]|uniref:hypothetical protein n=1 Tax=Ferrovibrio sp. TaxID=1917215 RepID=UPI0025B7CE9C
MIDMTTGEVVSYALVRHVRDMPPHERAGSRRTETGIVSDREDALRTYDSERSKLTSKIDEYSETRMDLLEKIDELPIDDGDNMAMRDLLVSYIKRLDRSLAQTQGSLEELDRDYGPDGTYRKDIRANMRALYSGKIYSEKLFDKVYGAKTVDEILENVGKLFLDLKKKMTELPADANRTDREELRSYGLQVQSCIDSVKDRLKKEFNWEGGDLDFSEGPLSASAATAKLSKDLGFTNPNDLQDAFLVGIAGSDEDWPDGLIRNPLDIVDHYLSRIEAVINTTRGRLDPLPEHQAGWPELGWILIRDHSSKSQSSSAPHGKVS